MAHSHERTLLASLGFSDPDKRDRRHTLACQYLCREDVALKLAGMIWPNGDHPTDEEMVRIASDPSDRRRRSEWTTGLTFVSSVIEAPITKSHGYLVGFVDVVLRVRLSIVGFAEVRPYSHEVRVWRGSGDVRLAMVEVKVKPVDIGDIARQMALYREHTDGVKFVVATCWRMSADDRATLRDKGIRTIYLGEPFEEYCRARNAEGADAEMEEF
ncbi:MAG TPA: hypothetical protein VI911_04230 [Patescibacteria group bacterium]|nr:hypothetical protein [Patescibacteria group bacterium]